MFSQSRVTDDAINRVSLRINILHPENAFLHDCASSADFEVRCQPQCTFRWIRYDNQHSISRISYQERSCPDSHHQPLCSQIPTASMDVCSGCESETVCRFPACLLHPVYHRRQIATSTIHCLPSSSAAASAPSQVCPLPERNVQLGVVLVKGEPSTCCSLRLIRRRTSRPTFCNTAIQHLNPVGEDRRFGLTHECDVAGIRDEFAWSCRSRRTVLFAIVEQRCASCRRYLRAVVVPC